MLPCIDDMEEQTEQLKKRYMLHYIANPGLDAAELEKYRATLNERMNAHGAQIEASICEEQVRNLSYPINKEQRGHFCEIAFLMEPQKIKDLSETISHDPKILRCTVEFRRRTRKIQIRRRAPEERKYMESAIKDKETGEKKGEYVPQAEKRDKISIEEIDKKLDEIIKNI